MNQTFVCKKCGKKFQAINERSRCKDCIIKDNLAKYSAKESEGFLDGLIAQSITHRRVKIQYGKYRSENMKEIGDLVHAFSIKDVIFNPPATIVYWIDGSKTVVKCSSYDEYDPMVGICTCVTKKLYGGEAGWASQIRRFAEKGYEKLLLNKYPIRPLFTIWRADSLSNILRPELNKYIPDESEKKRHQEQMIKEIVFGGPNNVACQRRFVILNPDEDEEKWQE